MGGSSSVLSQSGKNKYSPEDSCLVPEASHFLETETDLSSMTISKSESGLNRILSDEFDFSCKINRDSSHTVNWNILDELLKKNLKERTQTATQTASSLAQLGTNSFASKGFSVKWLFQWWDQLKSRFPHIASYSTRELWMFLVMNRLYGSTEQFSVSFILYEGVIPGEEKGFPDFVLAYNPDDNFDEIIKVLKCHAQNSEEGEIHGLQFIWIDFFLVNLFELVENKNKTIFYLTNPDDLRNIQEKFGAQIPNLMVVHIPQNEKWNSIQFLKNIYSLFYLSFFLWNGYSHGKITFLFAKNYSFEYSHLLYFMKEWQPMSLSYYFPLEKKKTEEENHEDTDNEGGEEPQEIFASAEGMMKRQQPSFLSPRKGSFKANKQFLQLTNQILLIFQTWNTMKIFVFFFLLKDYNISPFFFGEISPLCCSGRVSAMASCSSSSDSSHQRKGYLSSTSSVAESSARTTIFDEYESRADDNDTDENSGDEREEDYDEEMAESDGRGNDETTVELDKQHQNASQLWSQLFPGSRMHWKQMSKSYHFYYYDYKTIRSSYKSKSQSTKMRRNSSKIDIKL